MSDSPIENLDDSKPLDPVSKPSINDKELHYGWMKYFALIQLKVLYTLIGFISLVIIIDMIYRYIVITMISKIPSDNLEKISLEAYAQAGINPHDLITLVLPIFAFLVGMGSSAAAGK